MTYKVIAETEIKNCMVISLDKPRDFETYNTTSVIIDDIVYTYTPTHSNYIIVVQTTDSLLDKTVQFI